LTVNARATLDITARIQEAAWVVERFARPALALPALLGVFAMWDTMEIIWGAPDVQAVEPLCSTQHLLKNVFVLQGTRSQAALRVSKDIIYWVACGATNVCQGDIAQTEPT